MRALYLACGGLVTFVVSPPSLAQEPSIPVTLCDVNSDLRLSFSELQSCQAILMTTAIKPATVAECDTDGQPRLTREELTWCFRFLDPRVKEVSGNPERAQQMIDDLVGDTLDRSGRSTASLDEAAYALADSKATIQKQEPEIIGSDKIIVGRKLADALDPRRRESGVPFAISYTDDRASGEDNFVAAGEITYVPSPRVRDGRSSLARVVLPTIGFDLSTSKPANESSISIGAPIRWFKSNQAPPDQRLIDDWSWVVEPKYNTDRDFRRDAYELNFGATLSSKRLWRAGQNIEFGGDASKPGDEWQFHWKPSLSMETGSVTDAGGNAKLALVEADGEYVRMAPNVAVKLRLPFSNARFSLAGSYTQRFDLTESWSRGLGTLSVLYDLSSNVALTLTRRKGRKPPDFAETDDVLLGIGVQQVPKGK